MNFYQTVIILVNFNGFKDTDICVKSVLRNNEETLPFIVIVDNASTEKVNLERLQQIYSNLKIIKNNKNVGFGRANNIGIKWAQENLDFSYLLLLNNDTIIEPDSLFYLKEAFKVHPEIGITTSKTMYEGNRDVVWYGGGEINYKRGFPQITDLNKKASAEGANKPKYVSFISGCVMLFTKESIRDLEGFDDDIFMYCEDLELCLRAKENGYKLYYEPKSVIFHKVQGSSKSSKDEPTDVNPKNSNALFLFYHIRTNQFFVMRKYLSGFSFLVFNIFYWITILRTNFIMLRFKRFRIIESSFKLLKNNILNQSAI